MKTLTIEQIKKEVESNNPIRINIKSLSDRTGKLTRWKGGASIKAYAYWLIEDRGFNDLDDPISIYDVDAHACFICDTNHVVFIEDTYNGKWHQGNNSYCRFFMDALESEVINALEKKAIDIPSCFES